MTSHMEFEFLPTRAEHLPSGSDLAARKLVQSENPVAEFDKVGLEHVA